MRILKSLARGLETLDLLVDQRQPARLTDVAARLGVEKSNASHLLRTLVASGYAEQVEGRRYQATGKVRPMATIGLEDIIACREQLQGTLQRLGALTGECVHMAVLVAARVWYVDKIASSLPLKVDHPIGSLAPLHCTALGKAFLAFGNGNAVEPLASYTPKSITSRAVLAVEIARTRERGYSIDDEEFTLGIRCVAVPVFDAAQRMIAAVGLSGPTARIDGARLDELGGLVREHLGGRAASPAAHRTTHHDNHAAGRAGSRDAGQTKGIEHGIR